MASTGWTRRTLALGAGAAAILGLFAGTRSVSASTDPYSSLTGSVQLSSDVLSGLGSHSPTGALTTTDVTVGVGLSRPDPAGEKAYLNDVYNPSSPRFRQFLDTAGFAQRFGVSQSRFQQALVWLRAGGLHVTTIPGSTEYVIADGPATAVDALFHVQLATYSVNGVDFYANTSAPSVPANLGVLGVAGLQNYAHMQTMKQMHDAAVAHGAEPATVAAAATPGPNTNIGATTPQDLWSIYDQPANNTGQGESMAIFGWGCAEPADDPSCSQTDLLGTLRKHEATYNLPQMPVTVDHFGAPSEPINDSSGTGEWQLDMPASTGMAPGADLEHLYFGRNGQDPDILAAYNAWVADPAGPRQGSSSFAGCEATPVTGSQPGGPGNPAQGTGGMIAGNPNQDLYEAALSEAVALGRTMFNSAGDLGANGCPPNANTALNGVTPSESVVNTYPSSSDYVTTVGGTVLYWSGDGDSGATAATRDEEYAWTYSGGGTSLYIAAPSWQTGSFSTSSPSAPGLAYPCTTNWEASPTPYAPGTLCRGLPDVAAQSGDIISNGYFAGGGTSLSSPLWLGMWTRIQAASSNPGRLGFASPAIYANNADCSKYEKDFFDIGGTANPAGCSATALNPTPNTATLPGCDPNPTPYSCTRPGWDYASGWGTPDVTNLMKDLDGGNTAPVAEVPANVPEAPGALMLPLGAALVAGAAMGTRRISRRGRRAPA